MRVIFPKKIDDELVSLKQKVFPKTLFFRTMLLIFVPLIVVQIVSVVAYFHGSWGKVGRRLSENLSANMAYIVELNETDPGKFHQVQKLASKLYDLKVDYTENDAKYQALKNVQKNKIVTGFLEQSLKSRFSKARITLYLENKKQLVALIDVPKGLYRFQTSTKNIFSSSIFGFIAWMVGTSLLLFAVSALFLRVQARSIQELADSADAFGKGVDRPFKPYGSVEVRKAGVAFNKMKERIKRQISERTQMLAGVSHDLRTPLTRMKLALALSEDNGETKAFLEDVTEMEQMLEGYLSFARGDGLEKTIDVDTKALIEGIVAKFSDGKHQISYQTKGDSFLLRGREQALKRMITNVVSNACRYAKVIEIMLKDQFNRLEITIDDNGLGIAEDQRENVFKAFYRIETSRNKETGGVGLGLSITKDIVRSHGGTIKLLDSPLGGLRVEIKLPK